jgi:hypothetical protein
MRNLAVAEVCRKRQHMFRDAITAIWTVFERSDSEGVPQ